MWYIRHGVMVLVAAAAEWDSVVVALDTAVTVLP